MDEHKVEIKRIQRAQKQCNRYARAYPKASLQDAIKIEQAVDTIKAAVGDLEQEPWFRIFLQRAKAREEQNRPVYH